MSLDRRDAILQSLTPAVMVPRFGPCPSMEKPGHRYLVAEDGLWLEVVRPWLLARVPLCHRDVEDAAFDGGHRLPFGRIEKAICYGIRVDQFTTFKRAFIEDARRALPNEYAAWGVYDARMGDLLYRPLETIEAGPAGIKFHRPPLADHEHLAIDVHSHGCLGAYFSETDDRDDAGEVKASLVFGNLDTESPTFASRLCLLGLFVTDTQED